MPQPLPLANETRVQTIVQKFINLFGIPELGLQFNVQGCTDNAGTQYLGCYDPGSNSVNFPPVQGGIPEYVVAHECGHALERFYNGGPNEPITYQQGEGFARAVESMYLVTHGSILDFSCEKCHQSSVMLLPDNTIQCRGCGAIYYVSLYDPGEFKNVSAYSKSFYPGGRARRNKMARNMPVPPGPGPSPNNTLAQLLHGSLGVLGVMAPAALWPGNKKAVKEGAELTLGFAAAKGLTYNVIVENTDPAQNLQDFAFYVLGTVAGAAILKGAGKL